MGTTYKGIYIPASGETGWSTLVNANWTLLADAHITAESIFLPAGTALRDDGGQPANVGGTFPASVAGLVFGDSSTRGAFWTFMTPIDATTATLLVRPLWVPSATDASSHSVRWSMDVKSITGSDLSTAGTAITWTGSAGPRTANIAALESGQLTTTFTPAASQFVRLNLSRLGGDAADTYVGTVWLLGVRIDYTAV